MLVLLGRDQLRHSTPPAWLLAAAARVQGTGAVPLLAGSMHARVHACCSWQSCDPRKAWQHSKPGVRACSARNLAC